MRTVPALAGLAVVASLVLVPFFLHSDSNSQSNSSAALATSNAKRVAPAQITQHSATAPKLPTAAQSAAVPTNAAQRISQLPLSFEANAGQTDSTVKFLSRGRGYSLYLTGTEAVIALKKDSPATSPTPRNPEPISTKSAQHTETKILRMQLADANPSPRIVAADQLPGNVNYFIGNDRSKWRTNVPTYAKVQYQNVYPGVDLVYYGNQGQLEYDFVVAPNADPSVVQLRFNESEKLRINAQGQLLIGREQNAVRFEKPVIYQQIGETKKPVDGAYVLASNNKIGFKLGSYDRSQPLVIDPVLSYSTFWGATASVQGITVDASGNIFFTGNTGPSGFPVTNPYQAVSAGQTDAFVTKLTSGGTAAAYSTYLGGSAYDSATAIAVDSTGDAYVVGTTASTNFPVLNAIQSSNAGGNDAFVTKLDPSGSVLVYSTYLGGSFTDGANGVAVDSTGSAYVTGYTSSNNFPTANALQPVSASGYDAFVAKIAPAGNSLTYSTYLGGTGNDYGSGIAIDSTGSAYVVGYTFSTNFPTSANAFRSSNRARGNAASNAFVSKINPAGSALTYSTYIGGSGSVYSFGEYTSGIAIDPIGNAYIAGYTASTDYPTLNPIQPANNGGFDIFVTELNTTGSALVYSTYLGGSADDYSGGIALDISANTYVTGYSYSSNYPLFHASQLVNNGGSDVVLTKINPNGALSYSTYLGGSSYDFGYAIAVDSNGDAFLGGSTSSPNFPTVSPLQSSGAGFVAELAVSPTTTSLTASPNPSNFGQAVTLTATVSTQASGTPTGTVAFYDATTLLGRAAVSSGQAVLTTSAIPSTSQSIAAQYSGDSNFGPSIGAFSQTVIGSLTSISPTALSFGQQLYNTTTAAQIVTVSNIGNATLHISGIAFVGLNPQDFAQTNNCPQAGVATGSSCQINVTFTPTEGGNRIASLAITDDAPGSPQSVPLTGFGIMPLANFPSGASLSFGNQQIGVSSASQTITFENNGNAPLAISGITINGSNPGDYSQANFCPLAPVSLAPGATCSITVTFTPTAQGTRFATLTINDNVFLSPQQLGLVGTGTGQPITNALPTQAFIGGGSSAMFVELGQAAIALNGGAGGGCVWSQLANTAVLARDNRTTPSTDQQGNIWIVWSPGTGTCAAPTGNYAVYSYMSLDSVAADRCFFEVDSSSISGCVQILTVAPAAAGSNLLCYPSTTTCSYFGDTTGGLPSAVTNAVSNAHWFAVGTDLLPVDAKFATFRALAPCGQQVARQPFDLELRSAYGLGYAGGTPGVGVPIQSYYSTNSVPIIDFNLTGTDPISGLAVPPFSVSTVGAQPVVVVVSPAGGDGIGAATDIPSYVLMNFYNGALGRATDLLGPVQPYAVTSLVPEPLSGAYNTFEWSIVNSSQFHDSQDAYNCSGTSVSSNPLNLQSLNGQFANSGQQFAYRRRVVGSAEMAAQLQAGSTGDNRLGYFLWNANNASTFTETNGKYLTVNGVDPLLNSYTDGVLPGVDPSHPASNVTFKYLNAGDYPIWTALRIVTQSPAPVAVTNLVQATQAYSSLQHDFIPVSQLNVWHSHFYVPSINSNVAANGVTVNPTSPNDLCNGSLPEFGGDAGGSTLLKHVNRDFCVDFGDITGLINKTN
jgi:Bacterial Ig-like domain (group 3)/Beta-propeller repeat/Abnormal spindle-like microcephaly-assoc'd, ASPM-SPD-2-Hydin